MRRSLRLVLGSAWLLAFGGCASAAHGVNDALEHGRVREALFAYDRGRPELSVLQRIAALALEQDAQSKEPRTSQSALAALSRATPLTERVLVRLALRAHAPAVRAGALSTLARFGDERARAALRGLLYSADAEVRALAFGTLEPAADADLESLRRACGAPELALRIAAVRRLAAAPADPATVTVLAERARLDPSEALRIAALDALAKQGPLAADSIEPLLEAEPIAVRLAAIDALVVADRERAREKLAPRLADGPRREGIEAARMLLQSAASNTAELASARAVLERALVADDNALRAAAAVAIVSVHDLELAALARVRAVEERVRSVRFELALALDGDPALALLDELSARNDVVAAEAAAELARRRGASASHARLSELAKNANPIVRAIAVSALGRDLGDAQAVREALLDREPSVRIAAAGAILGAGEPG